MQNELWNSLSKDKKIKVLCVYWTSRYQKTKIHKTFETLYGKENLENENIELTKIMKKSWDELTEEIRSRYMPLCEYWDDDLGIWVQL